MKLLSLEVHFPFAHRDLIKFVQYAKKEYKVEMLVLHDLTDQFQYSRFPKTPEAQNSIEEIMTTRGEIRKLVHHIQKAVVIQSNHDVRIQKRAFDAGIHSSLLKSFRELFELPNRYETKQEIIIDNVLHQHAENISNGDAMKALNARRINQCLGHWHTQFGIKYIRNKEKTNWVANIGCMIDMESYAFAYAREGLYLPPLGGMLVLDGVPRALTLEEALSQ